MAPQKKANVSQILEEKVLKVEVHNFNVMVIQV